MENLKDNFTQIPNELLEVLMGKSLNKNETKILLFIIRKTYGFQKESDQISLSQFQNKLNISRQTVSDTLKRLQLVKIIRLVKKGISRRSSNEWLVDISDYQEKLVKLGGLVKYDSKKLVKIGRHTKESITKESNSLLEEKRIKEASFKQLNPKQMTDEEIKTLFQGKQIGVSEGIPEDVLFEAMERGLI